MLSDSVVVAQPCFRRGGEIDHEPVSDGVGATDSICTSHSTRKAVLQNELQALAGIQAVMQWFHATRRGDYPRVSSSFSTTVALTRSQAKDQRVETLHA